jgi:hypothetical protein
LTAYLRQTRQAPPRPVRPASSGHLYASGCSCWLAVTAPHRQGRLAPRILTPPRWERSKEAEILQGDGINPDDGKVLLADYAATWIGERGLRPKTTELYRHLLTKHLAPRLGQLPIADVKNAS